MASRPTPIVLPTAVSGSSVGTGDLSAFNEAISQIGQIFQARQQAQQEEADLRKLVDLTRGTPTELTPPVDIAGGELLPEAPGGLGAFLRGTAPSQPQFTGLEGTIPDITIPPTVAPVATEREQATAQALKQFAPSKLGEFFQPKEGKIGKREIKEDVEGRLRYTDNKELVFPGITTVDKEKSIFGTVGDLANYTPESIKKAETSNRRSDLVVRPEILKQKLGGKGSGQTTTSLRKEYTSLSRPFRDVRDSFARIQESAKRDTGAADISLIFNYMKMLDPESTVREGEFATAENAGGVSQSIMNTYNKIVTGGRLTDKVKTDFVDAASGLMKRQQTQQNQREKVFTKLSNDLGVDSKGVVIDFTDPLFQLEEDKRRIRQLEDKI